MRSQLHNLELVYPPISNQEAEWLKSDLEVIERLKQSNLYFIAQKPESKFDFANDVVQKIEDDKIIEFSYSSGDSTTFGSINIIELLNYQNIDISDIDDFEIEIGDKLIRIWKIRKESKEILDWFTTEKILHDLGRSKPFIHGMNDFRKFTKYNLHYIGISKKDDSFKRLIIKPHDKRLRILSNEHPLSTGSRVTDEMIMFFFKIYTLEFKQILVSSDFDEIGKTELEDEIRIIADAEKAFVNVLNANYNEIKFKDYPYSKDGLFKTSVDRYAFSINDDLEFLTDDNTIYGERQDKLGQSESDFISINKEANLVELVKIRK
ncbi:hypothetical protein J1N09_01445 [Aureitalea sp. L0-47]|uniref:hypothetical protein n=1 Tax=Aureitalea sp. L0-47 TaxID=2816962 RepID=UPI002238D9B1|nr:hypothetical protein [Aureitalea sp. L0-47]MCW5518484.1 hypothetical protein [Aureitalea sp. L0-47]